MADLKTIRRAAKTREGAEERFRAEIRAAYASGAFSLAEIAAAAGVSRQRAWQIVHHRR